MSKKLLMLVRNPGQAMQTGGAGQGLTCCICSLLCGVCVKHRVALQTCHCWQEKGCRSWLLWGLYGLVALLYSKKILEQLLYSLATA